MLFCAVWSLPSPLYLLMTASICRFSSRVSFRFAVSFATAGGAAFLNNRFYLLFHLSLPHERGVKVVGLIGALLGTDEKGLYHLPGDNFKGLAVPFIQRKQKARKHGEYHAERRRGRAGAAPEQKK